MQENVLYLVDSGIDETTNGDIIQVSFECNEQKQRIEFSAMAKGFEHEHGRIILDILKSRLPASVRFYSVKILDKELRAHYRQLVCALEWILEKEEPGIVNLSLGVMNANYEKALRGLVKQLGKKGIYPVCAASREYSLPSALNEVITVADYPLYNGKRDFALKRKPDFVVDVESCQYPFIPTSSPSYAAPFVSARALELMRNEKIRNLVYLKTKLSGNFTKWE